MTKSILLSKLLKTTECSEDQVKKNLKELNKRGFISEFKTQRQVLINLLPEGTEKRSLGRSTALKSFWSELNNTIDAAETEHKERELASVPLEEFPMVQEMNNFLIRKNKRLERTNTFLDMHYVQIEDELSTKLAGLFIYEGAISNPQIRETAAQRYKKEAWSVVGKLFAALDYQKQNALAYSSTMVFRHQVSKDTVREEMLKYDKLFGNKFAHYTKSWQRGEVSSGAITLKQVTLFDEVEVDVYMYKGVDGIIGFHVDADGAQELFPHAVAWQEGEGGYDVWSLDGQLLAEDLTLNEIGFLMDEKVTMLAPIVSTNKGLGSQVAYRKTFTITHTGDSLSETAFMKKRVEKEIEGKYYIYSVQGVKKNEAHMKDLINRFMTKKTTLDAVKQIQNQQEAN